MVNADHRVLLLDLENLGVARLRPGALRARLGALLAAAGEVHHVVAAYALADDEGVDPLASLLAELRIAPLRVAPGPDAAELALIAHARHVHAGGGRVFLVGSADGRFAELGALGRVELLVWEGQPVATRLTEVAHALHRLARPVGPWTGAGDAEHPDPDAGAPPEAVGVVPAAAVRSRASGRHLAERLLAAAVTGLAVAAGQRLLDRLFPVRCPGPAADHRPPVEHHRRRDTD